LFVASERVREKLIKLFKVKSVGMKIELTLMFREDFPERQTVIRQVPEPANICFKSMEFLIYFID
jgi:hypothetical protein